MLEMGLLLFLLLIAPGLIRFQVRKLRSRLYSSLPFKKRRLDLQPQQFDLPPS